jgi:hypothetical protein
MSRGLGAEIGELMCSQDKWQKLIEEVMLFIKQANE